MKLNFDGGELSSDAGCLLLREFLSKLGFDKLIFRQFKTTDSASYRFHTDSQNLMQMIFQICCGYFTDDCADELTNDPVLTAALGKDALASQPTISRFFGRMDETTLKQFCQITRQMRQPKRLVPTWWTMLWNMENFSIRLVPGTIPGG